MAWAATLAVPLLYAPWIVEPHLRYDDFDFLTRSRTWSHTWANVYVPMNEHVMPLARLDAGIVMQLVQPQSALPRAAEIHGVVAVIAGMWLLYLFIRRELGHPFYGVVAMTLWGVTSTYYECVTWYSASFFTLALDGFLLGLLAAQSYARTQQVSALVMCAVCCALAPAFHSTALLGGAWCSLYLWTRGESPMARGTTWRHAAPSTVPLLGTAAFGGAALLVSGGGILRASHYRGKTIFEAFDPVQGALSSLRTLADNQIPGALGIWSKQAVLPWPAVLLVVVCLVLLGFLWWRLAPRHPLFILGLAVIVGSDLLVYGARADWSYERSVHNWTRYHLFPHLGLVLFIVGGLPRLTGHVLNVSETSDLSHRQVLALGGLLALLTCCHWPRTHSQHFAVPREQKAMLERIERVDAVCRIERIDDATARAALGFAHLPLGYDRANAWELLRGSPSPVPMSVDAARSLLASIR